MSSRCRCRCRCRCRQLRRRRRPRRFTRRSRATAAGADPQPTRPAAAAAAGSAVLSRGLMRVPCGAVWLCLRSVCLVVSGVIMFVCGVLIMALPYYAAKIPENAIKKACKASATCVPSPCPDCASFAPVCWARIPTSGTKATAMLCFQPSRLRVRSCPQDSHTSLCAAGLLAFLAKLELSEPSIWPRTSMRCNVPPT